MSKNFSKKYTLLAVVFPVVVSFSFLHCGGDPDPAPSTRVNAEPATPEAFSQAFASAYCAKTAPCCEKGGQKSVASCEDDVVVDMANHLLNWEYLTYDSKAAKVCLDLLDKVSSCLMDSYDAHELVTQCTQRVFVGKFVMGDVCSSSTDLRCTAPAGMRAACIEFGYTTNPFRCEQIQNTPGKEGEPCAGLVDSGSPAVGCGEGLSCMCNPAASCAETRCQALRKTGEVCASYDECESMQCGPNNTCTDKLPLGATCTESVECEGVLLCVAGKCVDTPAAGTPCPADTGCGEDGYCSQQGGTEVCLKYKKKGEACALAPADLRCAGSLVCTMGQCADNAGLLSFSYKVCE